MTYQQIKQLEIKINNLIKDYQGKTDIEYINRSIDFTLAEVKKLTVDEYLKKMTDEFETFADNRGLTDIVIIYHDVAIDYLKKNDPSLEDSLSIAANHGYQVKDLNSELLASLLASDKEKDLFNLFIQDLKNLD